MDEFRSRCERIAFSRSLDLHGRRSCVSGLLCRRWLVFHNIYPEVTILDGSGRSIEWLYGRKIYRTKPENVTLRLQRGRGPPRFQIMEPFRAFGTIVLQESGIVIGWLPGQRRSTQIAV
jgi:hypothetical protein